MPLDDISTMLSIGTGIAVAISTTFIVINHWKERKKVYTEISIKTLSDFNQIIHAIRMVKDIEGLYFTIGDYVNYSDILTHLLNKKKIDKGIGESFEGFLHDAYRSGLFIDEKTKTDHMKHNVDLVNWCKNNKNVKTVPVSAEGIYKKLMK
ncbi:MAG: hypothetical protein OEW78_05795 [Nitrosopumilus sp.]|uniref:hypothetical protein n=1 Tax=Nitrosopumilus sp. TaxID=2024843 RepID=UPI00246D3FFA|nr:hypothetical protein [Nitrosopumilus sp.]MDH5431378.1 hypothetical protein [Nitrosopumilus sp.]